MQKVGVISLGCSKNLVDSEQMLYILEKEGFALENDISKCDAVVVNTCGFIEASKAEAIEMVLELAELKAEGKIKKIIVAGCLSERYKEEILKELPEVDAIIGCGSYHKIAEAVNKSLEGNSYKSFLSIDAPLEERERVLTTPNYMAYVKIAEGCDNRCSYCAIPDIRGKFRSRPIEAIVKECEELVKGGAKELVIIAQDTTRYGLDIYNKRSLCELLREICKIDGVKWIRLHYLYPDGLTDELIELIKTEDKILKYIDMPIQHVNDDILKAMKRRYTKKELTRLITKLRKEIEGVVIRTSIIAGLPGEDDDKFVELATFLKKHKLERAGIFAYSAEENTPAYYMDDQVDDDLKIRRRDMLILLQNRIMDKYNKKQLGKTIEVLCEGYDKIAECYYGRSYQDSRDIDGKIFFTSKIKIKPSEFVNVKINDIIDGDLLGEVVK